MPVNINVNIDVLGIAQAIANAVNADQDREGFVKNLMETSFYSAGQQYNVMVFNLNQNYDDRFNNVVFYGSTVFQGGVTYGIWAFESGEFTNQGDGGWINWAFRGWFERDGNYVKFNHPFRLLPQAVTYSEESILRQTQDFRTPDRVIAEVKGM